MHISTYRDRYIDEFARILKSLFFSSVRGKFQANETPFRFSLDLNDDFFSSVVPPSLDRLLLLFFFLFWRNSSLMSSSFDFFFSARASASFLFASRISSICRALIIFDSICPSFSALTIARIVIMLSYTLTRSGVSHRQYSPHHNPKLIIEKKEEQTWSSTKVFPFFLPFGVCTPTGVIIFNAGKSNSFSVYSLVFVFFWFFGALRDWDLTSFGGGRPFFDLDLPALDLLTLNADEDVNLLLLLPFEELFEDPFEDPLAGPLENVGAIRRCCTARRRMW